MQRVSYRDPYVQWHRCIGIFGMPYRHPQTDDADGAKGEPARAGPTWLLHEQRGEVHDARYHQCGACHYEAFIPGHDVPGVFSAKVQALDGSSRAEHE